MTTAVNGYKNPTWDFSDRLRKIRREVAGMTQEEMATELGTSQRAYAAWETGRTKPDDIVAVAKRIAIRWRISPAWTLGIDETPPPNPDGPDGGLLLPRMDSNHQPCDSLHPRQRPYIPYVEAA
jgi:transcriptional regulator with XRE-family HTH domain